MATIKTLAQLLAELPDNTTRLIKPVDSRDIAATAFGYVGGTDPGPNNDRDDTAGLGAFFDQGSRWYNSALNRLWICLTGVPTAAVWAQITGPAGPAGSQGLTVPGRDGEDAEELPPVPGPQGLTGAAGQDGASGLTVPGQDGQDAEELPAIPGPQGETGERGLPGQAVLVWEGDVEETPLRSQALDGLPGAQGLSFAPLRGEDGEDGQALPWPGPAWLGNPDTCRLSNTGAQSVSSGGTGTALTFDTETWDSNGLHSTSANTSRITCVNPGKYLVCADVTWAANATGIRSLGIVKNGTGGYGGSSVPVNSGTLTTTLCVTVLVDMVAGDYVEAVAAQTSGGNLNASGQTFSAFQFAP